MHVGTTAPVDDLRLVDFVPLVVAGGQTGRVVDGAIDICEVSAGSADKVVMVVADAVLIAGRGTDRLDAPDQSLLDQDGQGVVHRLAGDGADLAPGRLGDAVRRHVRLGRHRAQDGQALRRDLQPVLSQQGRGIWHGRYATPQFWTAYRVGQHVCYRLSPTNPAPLLSTRGWRTSTRLANTRVASPTSCTTSNLASGRTWVHVFDPGSEFSSGPHDGCWTTSRPGQ